VRVEHGESGAYDADHQDGRGPDGLPPQHNVKARYMHANIETLTDPDHQAPGRASSMPGRHHPLREGWTAGGNAQRSSMPTRR